MCCWCWYLGTRLVLGHVVDTNDFRNTLVVLAAGAVHDVELEPQRAGVRRGTQVYVALTRLCCAAVICFVDQLLARFAAVGALFCWALIRLTLDAHGIDVTNTGVAATCPCVTRLFGFSIRSNTTAGGNTCVMDCVE